MNGYVHMLRGSLFSRNKFTIESKITLSGNNAIYGYTCEIDGVGRIIYIILSDQIYSLKNIRVFMLMM